MEVYAFKIIKNDDDLLNKEKLIDNCAYSSSNDETRNIKRKQEPTKSAEKILREISHHINLKRKKNNN